MRSSSTYRPSGVPTPPCNVGGRAGAAHHRRGNSLRTGLRLIGRPVIVLLVLVVLPLFRTERQAEDNRRQRNRPRPHAALAGRILPGLGPRERGHPAAGPHPDLRTDLDDGRTPGGVGQEEAPFPFSPDGRLQQAGVAGRAHAAQRPLAVGQQQGRLHLVLQAGQGRLVQRPGQHQHHRVGVLEAHGHGRQREHQVAADEEVRDRGAVLANPPDDGRQRQPLHALAPDEVDLPPVVGHGGPQLPVRLPPGFVVEDVVQGLIVDPSAQRHAQARVDHPVMGHQGDRLHLDAHHVPGTVDRIPGRALGLLADAFLAAAVQ